MKQFKTLSLIVMILALLVAVAPGKVSAQTKFPGYVSGIQVQNLDAADDPNVTLTYYYADDGSANAGQQAGASATVTINGNSSATYFPATSPFNGSLVISSGKPMAAVSNIQNSAGTAMASYVGASSGAASLNLPLLMKGNGSVPYDTWFSIQNTSATDIASISIQYSDIATPVQTTIKPNASKTFYQSKEAHTTKVFAATITSNQPIVGAVVQENVQKLLAYTAFPPTYGTPNPVMPLINTNNSQIVTGVQIQNTTDTDTVVTISYTPSSAGTACTETQPILAHTSKTFALQAFSGAAVSGMTTTCIAGAKFVGSAKVTGNTAGVNLVGIVNQNKTTASANYSESYGAFNPALATPKVVMPLLMDRNGSSKRLGTAFSVMNVGANSTFVKCTLSNLPAGVTFEVKGQLNQGASMLGDERGKIGLNYVGSGTCTAYSDAGFTTVDTTAKLVATVNEVGVGSADLFMVYEGINVQLP